MSVTATEQQERDRVIKISNTNVNRSVSSHTKVANIDLRSKERVSHPLHPSLPSSSPLRQSYKLKTIKEQNNVTNSETLNKLLAAQKAVTLWKGSKLYSKTLSTIDGMHSVKKTNLNTITPTTKEYASSETNCTSVDTNIASSNTPTATSSVPVAKTSEWKLLKNKLSLLRRKGNKEISGVCNNNAFVAKDIKAVNADCSFSKHEKLPQASQQRSISPILAKKGLNQEKGIVCKKEDLMHIISEASKGVKVSKTRLVNDEDEKLQISPTTSTNTSIKRNAFKKQHSCGSQSSDKEENSTSKQSNIRRTSSCERKINIKNQYNDTENSDSTLQKSECYENESKSNENELEIRLWKESEVISDEPIAITETNYPYSEVHDNGAHNQEEEKELEEELEEEVKEASAAVQWDDINFVDPLLLGDAIETFLRGLGSPPVTNSSNEKRVSFKKSI
jgi:hypothetical protein